MPIGTEFIMVMSLLDLRRSGVTHCSAISQLLVWELEIQYGTNYPYNYIVASPDDVAAVER